MEIMETIDYGETDLRSVIEGDSRYDDSESFRNNGYSTQEFDENEELVDVEEEEEFDDDMDLEYSDMDIVEEPVE